MAVGPINTAGNSQLNQTQGNTPGLKPASAQDTAKLQQATSGGGSPVGEQIDKIKGLQDQIKAVDERIKGGKSTPMDSMEKQSLQAKLREATGELMARPASESATILHQLMGKGVSLDPKMESELTGRVQGNLRMASR
jgi:hypothetical protein